MGGGADAAQLWLAHCLYIRMCGGVIGWRGKSSNKLNVKKITAAQLQSDLRALKEGESSQASFAKRMSNRRHSLKSGGASSSGESLTGEL